MKIMFVTQNLGKGGAERVISNLSNKLIEKYDVSILINSKRNIAYHFSKKIKIIETDTKKYINNNLIRNIIRIKEYKRIFKEEKPDIVICFLPLPSFRTLILKNKFKFKVIVSDRNDPNIEYNNVISKLLMKLLYKKSDGYVFQTIDQQNYFDKRIREKSTIILNPLKDEFLLDDDIKKQEKSIIINVGRLEKQKNQKLLIESFKELSLKYDDLFLKIFGEGSLKEELENVIKSLDLCDKVQLCGLSDNIKKEYLNSKIFVLSSDYEGLPNALMEAMASGMICVSTDCPCGGPKTLIQNNVNGFLVPVNDKENLIRTLDDVLLNYSKYEMIKENAKKIREETNEEKIILQWENYIEDILKK